jgi:hypothetical protein
MVVVAAAASTTIITSIFFCCSCCCWWLGTSVCRFIVNGKLAQTHMSDSVVAELPGQTWPGVTCRFASMSCDDDEDGVTARFKLHCLKLLMLNTDDNYIYLHYSSSVFASWISHYELTSYQAHLSTPAMKKFCLMVGLQHLGPIRNGSFQSVDIWLYDPLYLWAGADQHCGWPNRDVRLSLLHLDYVWDGMELCSTKRLGWLLPRTCLWHSYG